MGQHPRPLLRGHEPREQRLPGGRQPALGGGVDDDGEQEGPERADEQERGHGGGGGQRQQHRGAARAAPVGERPQRNARDRADRPRERQPEADLGGRETDHPGEIEGRTHVVGAVSDGIAQLGGGQSARGPGRGQDPYRHLPIGPAGWPNGSVQFDPVLPGHLVQGAKRCRARPRHPPADTSPTAVRSISGRSGRGPGSSARPTAGAFRGHVRAFSHPRRSEVVCTAAGSRRDRRPGGPCRVVERTSADQDYGHSGPGTEVIEKDGRDVANLGVHERRFRGYIEPLAFT